MKEFYVIEQVKNGNPTTTYLSDMAFSKTLSIDHAMQFADNETALKVYDHLELNDSNWIITDHLYI